MSSHFKWSIVILLAATLLVVGMLTFRGQHIDAGDETTPPSTPIEQIDSEKSVEKAYPKDANLEQLAKQFQIANEEPPDQLDLLNRDYYAAEHALEALAAIEQMQAAGFEEHAELLKGKLVDTCPPGGFGQVAIVPEQEWIIDAKNAFCGSYSSSEEDLVNKAAWERFQIESRAERIIGNLKNLTLQQQSDVLLRQVENAQSWLDLEAIKHAIHSSYSQARATNQWSDIAVHRLGQDPQYQGFQARDIQTTALTLLQCIEYVNCGPNSPFTLSQCYTQPFCQPGWSLYDFFYNTHSPLENEQIFRVLGLLINRRRDG